MQKHINEYRDGKAIYRFLESKIGQPWDKVYSQICSVADYRSKRGQDLRRRIGWEIHKDVKIIDGNPVHIQWGNYYPLGGELYVHPETGLICKAPKNKNSWRTPRSDEQDINLILMFDGSFYEKIDGCWFHLYIEEKQTTYPVELEKDEYDEYYYRIEEITQYNTHKRQLSKKEIKNNISVLLPKGKNKKYMERVLYSDKDYKRWKKYFGPSK